MYKSTNGYDLWRKKKKLDTKRISWLSLSNKKGKEKSE